MSLSKFVIQARMSGPYGPFEILAYAGGLLLSSHKARGGDAQGNKTNTLTYRLYTVTSQLHCQHNTVHRGGDAQCNTTH